jgi:hypothetical protein
MSRLEQRVDAQISKGHLDYQGGRINTQELSNYITSTHRKINKIRQKMRELRASDGWDWLDEYVDLNNDLRKLKIKEAELSWLKNQL